MNSVLEHEVDEIGGWLHKLVQLLQVLELSTFFLVEDIKVVLRCIELHVFELGRKVNFLFSDLLIALLQLLLLFLK